MKVHPSAAIRGGITISRAALLPALRLACLAVEARATIPVLAHVAIESGSHGVTLRACTIDMEYVRTLDCEVRTPISATVPAHLLLRTVMAMSVEDLHLVQEGPTVTLHGGPTTATFWHMPPEDMPRVELPASATGIDIACETLASLIGRVAHAICRGETRYSLNGIFLHGHDDGLRAVATDGHRLALTGAAVAGELPELLATGIILPRTALPLVQAMLRGLQDGAHLRVSDNSRFELITSTSGVLRGKLIDGTFPDYAGIIPKDDGLAWITLERFAFARALRRLAIGSSRHEPGMELTATPDGLRITTGTENIGARLSETVPVAAGGGWSPEPFGLTTSYIRDAVAQMGGEARIGRGKASFEAVMLRDSASPRSLFLVMPRRV